MGILDKVKQAVAGKVSQLHNEYQQEAAYRGMLHKEAEQVRRQEYRNAALEATRLRAKQDAYEHAGVSPSGRMPPKPQLGFASHNMPSMMGMFDSGSGKKSYKPAGFTIEPSGFQFNSPRQPQASRKQQNSSIFSGGGYSDWNGLGRAQASPKIKKKSSMRKIVIQVKR